MKDDEKRIKIGAKTSLVRRGKKGTWTAEYWHQGQHRRKSLRTTNLRTARERAVELEASLNGATAVVTPTESPIADASTAYLTWLQTEGRRPKTVTKNRGLHKILLRFAIDEGLGLMSDVTPRHIDRFREIRKLTCSPKTMHNDAVALKSFFRWAASRRLIAASPMADMRFPRPLPRQSRGAPTIQHVCAILAAAPKRIKSMLATLAFTGMRVGELQGLRPQDVDTQGGWIHVESRDDRPTKTGHSRTIPIHPELRRYLAASIPRSRPWFFTAAPSRKYPAGDHWISAKHLNEDLLALLKRLGLPAGRTAGFTLHSLRHGFETACVNAGIPQRVVDLWMGHRSDRSMAAIYYHLSDEESQNFMQKVPFGCGENYSSSTKESET